MVYRSNRLPLTPQQVSQIVGLMCKDLIGNYTYDDGTQRKAISIGKPNKSAAVKGVEAVVLLPEVTDRNMTWTIFFVDNGNQNYDQLIAIIETIQHNIWATENLRLLPSNDELQMDNQLIWKVNRGELEELREKMKVL